MSPASREKAGQREKAIKRSREWVQAHEQALTVATSAHAEPDQAFIAALGQLDFE